MHELLLSQAALPAPVVIQRTPLRPYSLGHELVLIREGNAFLCGGMPTRKDLISAVWICSNTWDENRTAYDSFLAPLKAKLIARRFRKADLAYCFLQFREYIQAGALELPQSQIPRSDKNEAAIRIPGSPFLIRLHAFAMTHLRLRESEAWDYPYGLIKMRWQAHWEQEGGYDVYSPQDASFDTFIAEQEAKRKTKCQAS